MYTTRFRQWIVLACMGTLAACSGTGGDVGVTELNVIVPNSGTGTPSTIDIQEVEYIIQCDGNSDTFLDNNDSFADEVLLSGDLEVVDGRTSGGNPTEIWQGFMDLPPGPCQIQLAAVDNDGERICVVDHNFSVSQNTLTKIDLVLICDVSFQAPVGSLDVDATFSFIVGNFCPDLFVLNCLDSEPAAVPFPPLPFDIASTECQVRFRDGDSTCGTRCDPQSCTTDPIPVCTPGPDPGVSTTITCAGPDGVVDCDGNPLTPDTACTFNGDQLVAGEGVWFAGCLPPALGGTPGAIVTCTAVTTDGDEDCDKTKVVSITCPGLNFCDEPSTDCDDSNECTNDSCDPIASACVNDNVPAGGGPNCSTAPGGGLGECDGNGNCLDFGCTSDLDCDPGDTCNAAETCDLGSGACIGGGATNEGGSCDAGSGALSGTCQSGTCVDLCTGVVCDDTNECTDDPACDSSSGTATCPTPVNDDSNACTTCPGGPTGCVCNAGVCEDDVCVAPASQTDTVLMACGQNASGAIVPFPVDTTVTPNECADAGQPFSALIEAQLVLDQAFLQGAAETLASVFGIGLTEVDITEGQIQFDELGGGATCTPALSVIPGPFPITLPIPNDGSGSIPTIITGGVTVDEFPDVTINCVAGAAPGPYSICPDGVRVSPVTPATPTTETFIRIVAGGFIPVAFDCEPGTVNDNGTPDDDSDDFVDPLAPATDCPTFPVEP